MSDFGTVAGVVVALPQIVHDVRKTLGLALRDVAAESGVSLNTLSRFEHGKPLEQRNLVALLRWLEKRQPDAMRVMWERRERLDGWGVENPGADPQPTDETPQERSDAD